MIPKVPSEPTNRFVKLYPADVFLQKKKTISDSLLITTLLFMLNSWQFSSYSTPIYWPAHGQMTSTMKLIASTCHEQATLQKL